MIIKAQRGISASVRKHGLTHFLRIPFATLISIPQLQQSILQVPQDPIAAALPPVAWSYPTQVHFAIISLSLKTPDRVNAAVQLLQKLDMAQIADHIATSSLKNRPVHPAAKDIPTRDEETLASGQAPIVALQGLQELHRTTNYPYETKELRSYVKTRQPFLAQFRSKLCDEFEKAEFVPVARLGLSGSITCTLMDTRYLRTNVWRREPALRSKRCRLQPDFDASDLHFKYEKFPWTTEFPLEKLCISEFGLKDFLQEGRVVGTGYRDIACVPLAGASASPFAGGRIDGYTKAARTKEKNSPVTSLLIPSTPPLPRS